MTKINTNINDNDRLGGLVKCSQCFGLGFTATVHFKAVFEKYTTMEHLEELGLLPQCNKCYGTGFVDWVTNAMGFRTIGFRNTPQGPVEEEYCDLSYNDVGDCLLLESYFDRPFEHFWDAEDFGEKRSMTLNEKNEIVLEKHNPSYRIYDMPDIDEIGIENIFHWNADEIEQPITHSMWQQVTDSVYCAGMDHVMWLIRDSFDGGTTMNKSRLFSDLSFMGFEQSSDKLEEWIDHYIDLRYNDSQSQVDVLVDYGLDQFNTISDLVEAVDGNRSLYLSDNEAKDLGVVKFK